MDDTHELDVVIVGAGIYGIAASKFYLDAHPNCRLALLEQDLCPGGSWNSRRLYPTFWTQIGLRMAEFSDLPMVPPSETLYDLYDAKHVAEYLEKYVDKFYFEGRSLRDRMVFGFTVAKIEKVNGKWDIHGHYNDRQEAAITFHAPKVMIASGLTSTPNMPILPNQEHFQGSILHQKDFGQSSVLSSNDKYVTVVGGAKSAADMVYASVKAGKSVSWIIRKSGSGPAAFLSSEGKGRYKNSAELGFTRIMGTFTPSYFTPQTWWTRFLHKTGPGNWMVSQIWNTADKLCRDGANFDARPEAQETFKNLKPTTVTFWSNDTLGLIQHPDFWQTIAENVQVYRNDIRELAEHLVRLDDGTEVPTDILLCGTGWISNSPRFFHQDQIAQLGLPHRIDQPTLEDPMWEKFETEADHKILAQFPRLARPPDYYEKPAKTTPYRFYNYMAPLHDDSIVFLGHIYVPNAFRAAECQAIWATAYLDGQITLPSMQEMQVEIALTNAWNRRRYLNNGHGGNFLHYDLIGYTDNLLRELGLSCRRKGWFEDLFAPCTASDFVAPRKEYLERVKGKVSLDKRDRYLRERGYIWIYMTAIFIGILSLAFGLTGPIIRDQP